MVKPKERSQEELKARYEYDENQFTVLEDEQVEPVEDPEATEEDK